MKSLRRFLRQIFFLVIGSFTAFFLVRKMFCTKVTHEEQVEHIPLGSDILEEVTFADNINKYCRHLEHRFYSNPQAESESILTRAKRAKIIRDALILLPSINQMWCLVPKAASTSWAKILMEALNESSFKDHKRVRRYPDALSKAFQIHLRDFYASTSKNEYIQAIRNEDIFKVLLIRHPFSRIASAYRNKLRNRTEAIDGMHFYQHYGAKIMKKYRKNHKLKQREPTFTEFIDYLIDTDPINYDEHWQPISVLCGICHIKYNLVIKMESLRADHIKRLMKKLGFNPSIKFPHENPSFESNVFKMVSDYYQNISRSKMILLYKKYEMDFHAFNYSFLNYYLS